MKYLLIVLTLFPMLLQAQALSITGSVTNGYGKGVGMAAISIVGQNPSATTDDDGLYVLQFPKTIKYGTLITLRVHKAGYFDLTKQVAISQKAEMLTLKEVGNSAKVKEKPAVDYSVFMILNPAENSKFDLPRTTTVSWTLCPNASYYELEVQLCEAPGDSRDGKWAPLPHPDKGIFLTTEISQTFTGMGEQVHRFRVIAKIGEQTLAVTPWRYVSYYQ